MKPSGSLSDIAGSVKGYLRKKQQRRSLAAELFEVRRQRLAFGGAASLPSLAAADAARAHPATRSTRSGCRWRWARARWGTAAAHSCSVRTPATLVAWGLCPRRRHARSR